MSGLSLAEANHIISAAFACAGRLDLKPISVAVLDAGGHLIAFQRQDYASMLRFEIAFGKARTVRWQLALVHAQSSKWPLRGRI